MAHLYRNKKPLGIQLISEKPQNTSREFNFSRIPIHLIVNSDDTYMKYHAFAIAKKVITKAMR